MTDAISGSSQTADIQAMQKMMKNRKPEDMFKQLSTEAGGDGTSVTKKQLEDLSAKNKAAGKDTKGIDDLVKNYDKISTGKDSEGNSVIKSDDIEKAVKNGTLKPPSGKPKGSPPAAASSSTKTGSSSSSTLTKDKLQNYLNELKSMNAANSDIASKIQQAISNYGKASGSSTLTEADIEKAIKDLKSNKSSESSTKTDKDPQDPSTITSDQLEPPIDIRV